MESKFNSKGIKHRILKRLNHNWASLKNVKYDSSIDNIRIDKISELIGSTYMHKCIDIEIEQSFIDHWSRTNYLTIGIDNDIHKSLRLFNDAKRQFIASGYDHASVRFRSGSNFIYVFIDLCDTDLNVCMIEFDSKMSVVIFYDDVTLTDEVIYSKFGSRLNEYIRLNINNPKTIRNIILLARALNGYINNPNVGYVEYSPFEMEVYQTLMNESANIRKSDEYFMLLSYAELNGGHTSKFKINLMLVDHVDMIDSDQKYPVVDLNEKEWNYIYQYCSNNKYTINDTINLVPFISTSRYGNTFVLENTMGYQDIIDFTYDNNILRFRIQTRCSGIYDDLTIIQEITFANIENFVMSSGENFRSIAKFIHTNDRSRLSNLPNSVYSVIPYMSDASVHTINAHEVIWQIISLLITTYFHPERTRMIKVSERVNKYKSNVHTESSTHHDSDIVISRILKSTRDAKEYIRNHSSDECHREYVMEKWMRVGHYRKYADGHTVWIEPTTCHRQLDLTDKEIKITL